MRRYLGLVALALSCSSDPPAPTSAPPAPLPPAPANHRIPDEDCTRVLDDAARTTLRIKRHEPSYERSDEVRAVRAKSGLTDVGGDNTDARPAPREPSGRSRCDELQRAPVIIITKDELRVGTTHVASLAEARSAQVIDALARALPGGDIAILQADESTDAVTINHVVNTCKHAGYTHLLFAVTNKGSATAADDNEPTREIRLTR